MEQAETMSTYCVFCISGREEAVMRILRMEGWTPLAPFVEGWGSGSNGVEKKRRRLLPGYVFFDAEEEPDWTRLSGRNLFLKVLRYSDGSRRLRGSDLEFANWLKRCAGVIGITKVIREGTKIKFVQGPLKDLQGTVLRVNKRRRQVQIAIGSEGQFIRTIWCGIEYIETSK